MNYKLLKLNYCKFTVIDTMNIRNWFPKIKHITVWSEEDLSRQIISIKLEHPNFKTSETITIDKTDQLLDIMKEVDNVQRLDSRSNQEAWSPDCYC